MDKPRLLVLSTVYPYPGTSGQQQRVMYTLRSLRNRFHVTFLTVAPKSRTEETRMRLEEHCDTAVVMPSRYDASIAARVGHRLAGALYAAFAGLRASNYVVRHVEFTAARLRAHVDPGAYRAVLAEYWHATASIDAAFGPATLRVLDAHDVLWQSYDRRLAEKPWLPRTVRAAYTARYRKREERAWCRYDLVIAINRAEREYIASRVPSTTAVAYVPMGVDLSLWPFGQRPARPPRLAYYGGMGSAHNRDAARQCVEEIMPRVWEERPDTEFWIVGGNVPPSMHALERDPRVRVTGYVPDVADVLRTMTCVLCPWHGTYGFRSRLVEALALGVPVIASHDAVHGMDFRDGEGVFLHDTPGEMAEAALRLLRGEIDVPEAGRAARAQVESMYSFEASYGPLAEIILATRIPDNRVGPGTLR